MADETLQQAIGLIKAGKDSEARGLLFHIVKADPRNEMAWLWLSETMNEGQRPAILEQALRFNPGSEKIIHALQRLQVKQSKTIPLPKFPPADKQEAPEPKPEPAPKPVDRSTMQTARLTFLPEDEPPPPPTKAIDKSEAKTAQLPPLPKQIDRSLIRTARLEMPPDELAPDKLPSDLAMPKPSFTTPKKVDNTAIKTSQLAYGPDEPVGKPVLPAKPEATPPAQAKPVVSEKSPVQAPPPSDRIDRSLLKAARFEQAEPPKTGPLHVPPAAAAASTVTAVAATPPPAMPPAKPEEKSAEPPATPVQQQMDALLSEPHPSPDPVQKPKKAAPPPPPTTPPQIKEETPSPKQPKRRRLSALEILLVVIVILLVIAVAGFLAWDFLVPKPPTPTPAAPPPAVTLATATLPATNTPLETPTPIPPPTLRPTFTPMVSPTPTLNPDSPSILFMDPSSCVVRQVSSSGGFALVLTGSAPANCLATELSPDGTHFAYRDSQGTLYVADASGLMPAVVVDPAEGSVGEVDWAPDSNWISYTSITGAFEGKPIIGLSLIRQDGTNPFRLSNEQTPSIISDSNTAVSWSPDGQWIAFYADNRPYIIKPDGTGLDQLSEDAGSSVIAWSSDSKQIAFYSSDLNNPGIVILGINGQRSFVQNDDLKVPVSGDALSWFPDGQQLTAYDVAGKALVLVNRSGTQIEALVSVAGIPTRLSWSPDGSQLAYLELPQQDSPSGVLKLINSDGTNPLILTTSAGNATLRWQVSAITAQTVTPAPTIKVPTITPSPSPTP